MNPIQYQALILGKSSRLPHFLGRVVSFLLLAFSFGGDVFIPARAAQTPAPLTLSSNRYLFIVDTSLSMKPRASGALQRIETLLLSDLNGNLRPGDTLGLWTYNEKLMAGQFPLQIWSKEQKQAITKRFIAFMRNQPIEKKPKLAEALTPVSELVKNSDNLTVLLFSAGDEKIRGTPFDDEINAVYKKQSRSMQKAGMPFVTVLRAQDGKIFGHSVNYVPWPIDIPPFPRSVEPPQRPLAKPTPTNPPPLIVRARTNSVASATLPEKVPLAAEVKNDKPALTEKPTPIATESLPSPVNIDKSVEPSTVKSEAPSVAASLATSRPPTTAPVNDAPKLEAARLKPSEPNPTPSPVVAEPAVSSPPAESKPIVTNIEPNTAAPITKSAQLTEVVKTENEVAASESSTPIQSATALAPNSWFSGGGLLITAIVLLLVALGLIVLFVRRARNMSQPSLITHSLDRREK